MEAVQPRAVAIRALRVLRAPQWLHLSLLPCAAVGAEALTHPARTSLVLARGLSVAALALAFAYGLNAIGDRPFDRSRRKNPLAGVAEVPLESRVAVAACASLSLALAATGGPGVLGCAALSLLTGALYSAGPRLKAYPIVGTALNVGIFLPLMWLAGPPASAALPVAFVTMLLQNQLWHERQDLEEDRAASVWTTGAALGARGTAALTVALGVGGAGLAAAVSRAHPALSLASGAACAMATVAPLALARAPARRRAVHRVAALASGALVYAAALTSG